MRVSISIALVTLSVLALLFGCEAFKRNGDGGGRDRLASIRAAPRAVVIDGTQLTIESYIWRDFMPIAPPDGQPMRATVQVVPSEGPYPEGVEAMKLWVIHGDRVWESELEQQTPGQGQQPGEYIAREGPKWQPGISVDVVVQLRDTAGETYLLGARDQRIQKTM